MLVHRANQGRAGAGGHRPERDPHHGAGCNNVTRQRRANTASSTVPAVPDSGRPSIAAASAHATAAAQEAGAVGLGLDDAAGGAVLGNQQVRGPDFRLRGRPAAAGGKDGAATQTAQSGRTSWRRPDAQCRPPGGSAPARHTR